MTQPTQKLTQRRTDTGKRLTMSEKLIIYAAKGTKKSPLKVAAEFGVSDSTVKRLWKDEGLAAMKDQVALVKESLADELYLTAAGCIKQVGVSLPKASAKDAAVAAGIMIDKARLLEDKSTQNVGVHTFLDLCNSTPVLDDDEE